MLEIREIGGFWVRKTEGGKGVQASSGWSSSLLFAGRALLPVSVELGWRWSDGSRMLPMLPRPKQLSQAEEEGSICFRLLLRSA